MAGKPTPRSLRPAYVIESGRREVSSFSELSSHSHANSDAQYLTGGSSYPYIQGATLHSNRHMMRLPSNRSDAAVLAMELDERLAAAPTPRQYRYEIAEYDAVFDELIRQVSVHCSERGALLSRLKEFYSRSVDATERLGEAARARRHAHISALEAECASLRAKLTRMSAEWQKPKTELCKRLYGELPREDQLAVLSEMFEQLDERARAELLKRLTNGRQRQHQRQPYKSDQHREPSPPPHSSTLDFALRMGSSDDENLDEEQST